MFGWWEEEDNEGDVFIALHAFSCSHCSLSLKLTFLIFFFSNITRRHLNRHLSLIDIIIYHHHRHHHLAIHFAMATATTARSLFLSLSFSPYLHVSMMPAMMMHRSSLLERSDVAWKYPAYVHVWEGLRDEFEIEVKKRRRFLQNKRKSKLRWGGAFFLRRTPGRHSLSVRVFFSAIKSNSNSN
jgi:hypothetical protein